jgi:hypothetical protein
MSETTLGILGVIVVLGILFGVAWALDRRRKTEGDLFTGKSTRTLRIIAFLLGLIFGGVFIADLLGPDGKARRLYLIIAIAAFAYTLGADTLMRRLQKSKDQSDEHL